MEQYRDEVSQTGVDLNQVRVAYQEGEVGILELLDSCRVTRQALLRLVDLEALAKESQMDLDRARVDPMITLRNLTTVERRSGRLTQAHPPPKAQRGGTTSVAVGGRVQRLVGLRLVRCS